MYRLALALPITLITHDVLQILVALYIIRTDNITRVTYYLLGDTCLARYLNGKRAARPSDGKLEECPHLLSVIEHRGIHHVIVALGKVFQILIVRRYHSPCFLVTELFQHGLGNRTTYLRLCSRAKLVNEQQGLVV